MPPEVFQRKRIRQHGIWQKFFRMECKCTSLLKMRRRKQSLGKDLSASQKEDTVNINTASKEELMTLPGIGESRADAVIACREEKGSFTSIEGIKDAAGIGDGIFNRIKDLITVN